MKIYFSGVALSEGKIKYSDARLEKLDEKFKPKKVVPFFAEFTSQDLTGCEAMVIKKEKILDLLIPDIDKLENRLAKSADEKEKNFIKKCIGILEDEKPLCDERWSDDELFILNGLAPMSAKPVLVLEEEKDADEIIKKTLEKAGLLFFYTVNKNELKSWLVKKGSDIITCAGKIHSDFAKGFIKADVINYNDFAGVYNMCEAKDKGLVKTVDRDHIIQDGDIIEIRFNVSKKT